jgi:hypothetical protein
MSMTPGDLFGLPAHGLRHEAGLREGLRYPVDVDDVEGPAADLGLDDRRGGVGGGLGGGHVAVLAHVELGHDASW